MAAGIRTRYRGIPRFAWDIRSKTRITRRLRRFRTQRYTHERYDVGVNYSRPLSLSRRTTFSFGTGSAVLDDGVGNVFQRQRKRIALPPNRPHVGGKRRIRPRFWHCRRFRRADLRRFREREPRGTAEQQVTLSATGGFANGNVGVAAVSNPYHSFQATTRVEWTVQRDRTAIYGNYYYYGYEFDADTPTVVPMANQIGRHGARAGLIFRFPLPQKGRPRVTR